jgi:hypothetical protein
MACATGRDAVRVDAAERSVTVWEGSPYSGRQHVCTERLTSDKGLSDRSRFEPRGSENAAAGHDDPLRSEESVLNVEQLTQFGDMALYRLCEAAGNGFIAEDTYVAAFTNMVTMVYASFEAQRRNEPHALHGRLLELRKRIDTIDRRNCDIRLSGDEDTLDDDEALDADKRERGRLSREFEALRSSTNAYFIEPPRQLVIPTRRQVDEFEKDATEYLRLDARASTGSAACANLKATFGSFWRGACYATNDDRVRDGERTALRVIDKGCAL